MKTTPEMTRRSFVQKASTITAIGFAAPGLSWASASRPAARKPRPNRRTHRGIIGCGGMGNVNLSACASQPDVVVTAACDVWDARREPVGEQFKDTCKLYGDFRQMLQQEDLDRSEEHTSE